MTNSLPATELFSLRAHRLRAVGVLLGTFMALLLVGLLLVRGTLSWVDAGQLVLVGGPVGALLGVYEVYVFPHLLPGWPLAARFGISLLLRLLAFGLLLLLGQQVTAALLAHAAHSAAWRAWLGPEAAEWQAGAGRLGLHPLAQRALLLYGGIIVIISALHQASRLVGLRALARLMLGYYDQPVAEERLFLFVDLRGSTALAEQLGHLRYSALVRDFFYDVGAPIAAMRGEVYQYVGDEVVVSWPWATGLARSRGLRCVFGMQQAVERRRAHYLRHYGVVPVFKAGLHGGVVVATQVGAVRAGLVFHGDVLNTTARIQAQCNALGSRLLVSATVARALPPDPRFQLRPCGAVALRGKQQPVELFDGQLAAQAAPGPTGRPGS